jgi:hypothetical protein
MFQPYTYYLYHIPTGKKYYGYQYHKKCNPTDLWIKYFSSSDKVLELITEYGKDSFIAEVRKLFNTGEEAYIWEQNVLRRIKAVERDDWLNQACFNEKCFNSTGHRHTETHKQYMRELYLGRKLKEETIELIRQKAIARYNHPDRVPRMWIRNVEATKDRRILMTEDIPEGWVQGRLFYARNLSESQIKNLSDKIKHWHKTRSNSREINDKISNSLLEYYKNNESPLSGITPTENCYIAHKIKMTGAKHIVNDTNTEERIIKSDDIIPEGWKRGRKSIIKFDWIVTDENGNDTIFHSQKDVAKHINKYVRAVYDIIKGNKQSKKYTITGIKHV